MHDVGGGTKEGHDEKEIQKVEQGLKDVNFIAATYDDRWY